MPQRSEHRVGVLAGMASYAIWGLFPLYFHSLKPAGALEVLAHRVTWSFVLMMVVLAVQRRRGWAAELRAEPRKALLIAVAGVLLSLNWLVYVWAVGQDRVIDASLGYFVNPIVTVALGVVVLKEARNVKYADFVEPGRILTVSVEITKWEPRLVHLKAQGMLDGVVALSAARLVIERYNLGEERGDGANVDEYTKRYLRKLFALLYHPDLPAAHGVESPAAAAP